MQDKEYCVIVSERDQFLQNTIATKKVAEQNCSSRFAVQTEFE